MLVAMDVSGFSPAAFDFESRFQYSHVNQVGAIPCAL